MLDPNYWYSVTEIHYFLETQGYSYHRNTILNWITKNSLLCVAPKRKILTKGQSFNDFFYTQGTQFEQDTHYEQKV